MDNSKDKENVEPEVTHPEKNKLGSTVDTVKDKSRPFGQDTKDTTSSDHHEAKEGLKEKISAVTHELLEKAREVAEEAEEKADLVMDEYE
jgi:hypothetical protein